MPAFQVNAKQLLLQDEKSVPYRSTVEGVCHGCGHDAHTSILLGVVSRLAKRRPAGRVSVVF